MIVTSTRHRLPRRWAATGLARTRRAVRMRRPLRWRLVGDAIVVPPTSDSDVKSGAGVVARRDGDFDYVRRTGVRRYSRELVPQPQTKGLTANRSVPRAIFGGFAFDHFGHFLLESLSRLWIEQVEDIDDSVPLVWIGARGACIRPWMVDICRQIGLNREVILIDESTGALAVDELLVPDAGCEVREWMHPEQMRRLGTTPWRPERTERTERKVWLSRVGLRSSKGGLSEETEVELLLAERGWEIIRPEDLSIESQVEFLSRASRVAGVEGSALHGLVMVGSFGGTIDIIRRNSDPNFTSLALAGGWNQRILDPIGGLMTTTPVRNSFTGELVAVPTWDGIDVVATALAVERSSLRPIRG